MAAKNPITRRQMLKFSRKALAAAGAVIAAGAALAAPGATARSSSGIIMDPWFPADGEVTTRPGYRDSTEAEIQEMRRYFANEGFPPNEHWRRALGLPKDFKREGQDSPYLHTDILKLTRPESIDASVVNENLTWLKRALAGR